MPRNISVANQNALAARQLVARDFLRIIARDRGTGLPQAVGFWSDVGNVSAAVVHPDTGLDTVYDFYGSGTLIGIDDIPLVPNLTVQSVNIVMSQLDDLVAQAVRLYDCKQARIEVYRGMFNPNSRTMTAAAFSRFVGFCDNIEIKTPKEGGEGGIQFTAVSHTQEMTRFNSDTRSHNSQILRNATDNFYQDVAVAGEWEMFWGKKTGRLDTNKKSVIT